MVILGESSAEGVPYNFWVSIGAMIALQINEAIPGRRVHIETLASSCETLERQHAKLGGLTRRPDLIIIYCGHNEFSARFSASSDVDYYFDTQVPTVWSILVNRLDEISPLTALIDRTAEKCRIGIPPAVDGHRAVVDVPVYTSSDRVALLNDFRRRLETIVAYAERIGALPLLIVPPANDTDYEPNRSFLPAHTTASEREAFRRDFLAARRLEAADPRGSLAKYRELLARQPEFAETHYRIAQLLEREAAWDEAYQHYVMARDLDGYPMRAPSDFQHAYHEVAAKHPCILIDGQTYLHSIGRHGLLDDNLFQDAMHPSLRGQIALAQAILQAPPSAAGLRLACRSATTCHRSGPLQSSRFGLVARRLGDACAFGGLCFMVQQPVPDTTRAIALEKVPPPIAAPTRSRRAKRPNRSTC